MTELMQLTEDDLLTSFMDQPIRRRRRRTASSTSDLSIINDLFSDSANDSSGTTRRRRRRVANSDDLNTVPESPQPNQLSQQTKEITSEVSPVQPSPAPYIERVDQINLIRSEILDDNYHSELAESNFSDDTHDWGEDSYLISDDYWHFVGMYE